MNKEKILNKIGSLIDKADLTEEDLAKFFTEDEVAETPTDESEQLKPKDETKAEEAESVESAKDEGEATEDKEEVAKDETTEQPKTSSEAVAEEKPLETIDNGNIDELKKLIEGYKAEVDSLRKVLEEANVLTKVTTKDTKQVGYGTTSTPNLQRGEGGLDDTIAKLNRGRR